jgi:hypothetical protein
MTNLPTNLLSLCLMGSIKLTTLCMKLAALRCAKFNFRFRPDIRSISELQQMLCQISLDMRVVQLFNNILAFVKPGSRHHAKHPATGPVHTFTLNSLSCCSCLCRLLPCRFCALCPLHTNATFPVSLILFPLTRPNSIRWGHAVAQ